jgi:hypothetical protein
MATIDVSAGVDEASAPVASGRNNRRRSGGNLWRAIRSNGKATTSMRIDRAAGPSPIIRSS